MPIPEKYAKTVCKPGQLGCCSYLARNPEGWICLKHTPLQVNIDERRAEKSIRAMGDNCKGWDEEKNQERDPPSDSVPEKVQEVDNRYLR